jgi:hypothetical protein
MAPSCIAHFVLLATVCIIFLPVMVESSPHTVILGRVGAFYNFAMEKNPVFLHCVQGGAVAACGDLISQHLQAWTKRREHIITDISTPVSGARLLKASGTGVVFNGLLIPSYYRFVQSRWPSRRPVAVALKTAADAAIFGYFGNAATIAVRVKLEVRRPPLSARPPPSSWRQFLSMAAHGSKRFCVMLTLVRTEDRASSANLPFTVDSRLLLALAHCTPKDP